MKKSLIVLSILFFGVLFVLNISCEEDPKEACEQDEFCEGEPDVTLCCTDGEDCYWTYDGIEYPDTEVGLDSLYNGLGCTSATKSARDDDYIMIKLLEMRDRVIKASMH